MMYANKGSYGLFRNLSLYFRTSWNNAWGTH